ncbi:disrupter of silencing protein [Theileria orientalis strain Shintoku]|uniref:Disrupter of silencing protein n=1 Tax=Theileria orientalis strain Shintoku TaxID=869250 RepID=J4C7L3_THEOR|nr:disrupter of silencing protein [Theileria orientalis strain Shintoku]BAM39238.1 disrupter of silencing protein [Theileria orientalis strain Shintoku]|eukprot:XP_009689539.1 disrupter of silencing protein [Theileria orientalis strain Shintoku]
MGRNVPRKPKKTSEESDVKNKKKTTGSSFKAVVTSDGKDFIPFEEAEDKSTDEELEKLGLPRSFTPEATDDEIEDLEDEYEEGQDEEEEEEQDRVDWGKKLKNYYVDSSDDELDEEALEDRIAEARDITAEMYEDVEEEDADLDQYVDVEKEDDTTALDTLIENLSESLKKDSEKVTLPDDFFVLSDEQKKEFLDKEHPEFLLLLKEFKEKSDISNEQIFKLLSDPKSFKLCTKDGLEYLDIRNELFLMYLSYLTYYLLLKVHGISIENHPVIDRLLEIRLLLDKAKPIENKLQYQISKLLNNLKSKEESLVPRIENMELNNMDNKKYKAPKNIINQVHNEEDKEEDEKDERHKFMKKMNEIEEYEMERMRRIPLTKKYKKYMQTMEKKHKNLIGTNLQDLTSFTNEKTRVKSNSNDLNVAAQKLRQSVIMSEKRNNPDMVYTNKTDRIIKKRKSISNEGDSKSSRNGKNKEHRQKRDEIDKIKENYNKIKENRKQKYQQSNVRVYKPEEVIEGKRDIGKDIMKNRGLVVKRDKTQGNARVTNRRKFEKKMKIYNAMTNKNRKEAPDYVGEETGININKKKSLNA